MSVPLFGVRRRGPMLLAASIFVGVLALIGTLIAPAMAGDEPKGPTWGSEDRLSASQVSGTWFLFWPAAVDDGAVIEYRVDVGGEEQLRLSASVRMAMLVTNSHPTAFSVVAIDGAGHESRPLTMSGTVEPSGEQLPTLSVRVIERIGVDGGLTDTDSRNDAESTTTSIVMPSPPSTDPPATVAPTTDLPTSTIVVVPTLPSTTAPSTTAPDTTAPDTTAPSTTGVTTTGVTTTSRPDTHGEGECGPDVVVSGERDLSRSRTELGPFIVDVGPGRYLATGVSSDIGHGIGARRQDAERWSVRSDTEWTLPATPDLPDSMVTMTYEFGETTVTQAVGEIWFVWEGDASSANSVVPELRLRCVEMTVELPGETDVLGEPDDPSPGPSVPTTPTVPSLEDRDGDGIQNELDRWPFSGSRLDASGVASTAFVIDAALMGRVMSRDQGELAIRRADHPSGGRVVLETRNGDQLVDVVLCSRGLLGGHLVTLSGQIDLEVSCGVDRFEVRSGVASILLPDGRRLDVPSGTIVAARTEGDVSSWWVMPGGGSAILRGDSSEVFAAPPEAPMLVQRVLPPARGAVSEAEGSRSAG